jgi:hypothetical protein
VFVAGKVGINTPTPTEALSVVGNVSFLMGERGGGGERWWWKLLFSFLFFLFPFLSNYKYSFMSNR